MKTIMVCSILGIVLSGTVAATSASHSPVHATPGPAVSREAVATAATEKVGSRGVGSTVVPYAPYLSDTPPSLANDPYQSDIPPPSSYDLQNASVSMMPETHGMVAQLGRTLLALVFVVAIIYLLAKLALPRLLGRLPGNTAAQLKLVGRLQLDGKHAIMLVDIGGGKQLILGCGDAGVQLLGEVEPPSPPDFRRAMAVDTHQPAGNKGTGLDASAN